MTRIRLFPTLTALAIVSGCAGGEGPAVLPRGTTTGPHGSVAIPLPGDKGYAEVIVEREVGVPKGRKPGAASPPKIAVYFLGPDGKAPLTPPPSEVTVKAVAPTGDASTATLSPDAKAGDPSGGSRFLSPAGDYDYDELSGEVTATVDGEALTVPFAFR